jgi:hypothetical protein
VGAGVALLWEYYTSHFSSHFTDFPLFYLLSSIFYFLFSIFSLFIPLLGFLTCIVANIVGEQPCYLLPMVHVNAVVIPSTTPHHTPHTTHHHTTPPPQPHTTQHTHHTHHNPHTQHTPHTTHHTHKILMNHLGAIRVSTLQVVVKKYHSASV